MYTIEIYNQLHFYTYHIKMYTTLSVVNRVSIWHRVQQHYTWQKKQHKTPLDDGTRILHQATSLMSKVNRAHHWTNVSYLCRVVEGPDRSIFVKKITKQLVKHCITFEKHKPQTWVHNLLYLVQMSPKNLTSPINDKASTVNL